LWLAPFWPLAVKINRKSDNKIAKGVKVVLQRIAMVVEFPSE
jgi:hypothetical protein